MVRLILVRLRVRPAPAMLVLTLQALPRQLVLQWLALLLVRPSAAFLGPLLAWLAQPWRRGLLKPQGCQRLPHRLLVALRALPVTLPRRRWA